MIIFFESYMLTNSVNPDYLKLTDWLNLNLFKELILK